MSFLEELTRFGQRVGAFYLHGCPTIDLSVSDEIYVMLLGEMAMMAEPLGKEAAINRGYLSASIDVCCGGVNFKIKRKEREKMKAENDEPMLRYFLVNNENETANRFVVRTRYKQMAELICDTMVKSADRTVAMRKLLESMDCALRALNE